MFIFQGCAITPSRPTDGDDSVAKSQSANAPLVEVWVLICGKFEFLAIFQ